MKQILFFTVILLIFSCKPSLQETEVKVSTMGTTGSIKYISDSPINYQKEIDSLLLDVNMSLSTYIDSSTISKYNNRQKEYTEIEITRLKLIMYGGEIQLSNLKLDSTNFETNLQKIDSHFQTNLTTAYSVYIKTNQAFNPAIMPLVEYWKVQNKSQQVYKIPIDSVKIDSLVKFINKSGIHFGQLDFSAIAKGYGVDVIAYFLKEKGIENYMVEIGGEVHCKGTNSKNKDWKIGIEEPNEAKRKLYQVVNVRNKSMATSGNYRNFKVLDSGQKIVHIINPKTGYPEISNLLSSSIITDNCMEADAYATACMVMGTEKCFDFILSQEKLECYLIYSDEAGNLQTKISEGFKPFLDNK